MAGFLYFLPGSAPIKSRDVALLPESSGLRSLLDDCGWSTARVAVGPGGEPGALIVPSCDPAVGGKDPFSAYQAENQTWVQIAERSLWIGWEKEARPRPVDLLRPRPLDGFPVRLRDGNDWQIPCLHASPYSTIPREIDVDAAGEVVTRFMPGYEQLVEESAWFWEHVGVPALNGDAVAPIPNQRWYPFVCRVLGVNYRVDALHCGARILNLCTADGESMWLLVGAALGVPAIKAELEALAKKNSSTAPAGTAG